MEPEDLLLVAESNDETRSSCRFRTEPVQNNIGSGYRSFVYTEPYRASFFRDGLLQNDTAFQRYGQWLTRNMAKNFPDVSPFDQRALLRRQRGLFENAGFDTHPWDVILNGR